MADDGNNSLDRLSAKQERAVLCLVQGGSVADAASAAGVADRTMSRWRADATFTRAVREARRRVFAEAVAGIGRHVADALATLDSIHRDDASPTHCRVSAAVGVLKFARESVEIDDLGERIGRLEDQLAEVEAEAAEGGGDE